MELRNVKTFIKVAEMENFSKAALELGYAQSTVTTQVQSLEQELHAVLFERIGKRAQLSAAGQEFLEYAYTLQRYEAMAIEHFAKDQEPRGPLSVGVMETMCASNYANIFTTYMKQYPKVELKSVVATTLECMEKLEKGQLDLILTVDKELHNPNWTIAYGVPTEICFLFCTAPVSRKKRS